MPFYKVIKASSIEELEKKLNELIREYPECHVEYFNNTGIEVNEYIAIMRCEGLERYTRT